MKTSLSDEEYWERLEWRARMTERIRRAARYTALMTALALLLFLFLYYGVRRMGETHQSQWSQALDAVRSRGGVE